MEYAGRDKVHLINRISHSDKKFIKPIKYPWLVAVWRRNPNAMAMGPGRMHVTTGFVVARLLLVNSSLRQLIVCTIRHRLGMEWIGMASLQRY